MFSHRNLGLLFAVCVALWTGCETVPSRPDGPAPLPRTAAIQGWKLTLYNSDGTAVSAVHHIGIDDIISEDVLHQRITFRADGRRITHEGSWTKESIVRR